MWLREGMQEDEIAILKDAMQRRSFNERDLQHFSQEAFEEAGVKSAISPSSQCMRTLVEDVGRRLRGLDLLRGAEECAQKFEQEDIDGQVLLKQFTSETFEKFWEPLPHATNLVGPTYTHHELDGGSPSDSFYLLIIL
jgi:hypothetical protein